MSFANIARAEQRERTLRNILQRISMLEPDKINQLGVMLGVKRSVVNSTQPGGKLGGLLNKLGLNTSSRSPITRKVNNCLSAIEKTIDNNIIGLLGASLDIIGITQLLRMQEMLGNDFTRLVRSLGYLESFGAGALGQLQYALETGVQNTIMDVVAMGSDLAIAAINTASNEVFAALLPSLLALQNELGPVLGGITNAAEAVSALTNEITNDINNILYAAQSEFNALSNTIAKGLFDYSATKGTTCASRPDAQNNLVKLLRQTIIGT